MKNTLKKSLAVLVGLLVIASAVFGASSVFAADPDYGTVADGITKSQKVGDIKADTEINSIPATVGLQNGNFAEGLKYWAPKFDRPKTNGTETKASDYATVVDGVLTFKCAANYDGLRTVNFTLPYAKAGDTPVVVVKSMHNTNAFTLRLWELDPTTFDKLSDSGDLHLSLWGGQTAVEVKALTGDKQITDATSVFTLQIQNNNSNTPSTDTIDDIMIAKKNSDDSYTDLSTGKVFWIVDNAISFGDYDYVLQDNGKDIVGTEDKGIVDVYSADGFHTYFIDGLQNGDFSKGLKFWGGQSEGGPTASGIQLVTEGDNKYIQFKNPPADYKGLRGPQIAISDEYIDDGDQLTMIFDYKGSDWQFVLDQRTCDAYSGNGNTRIVQASEATIEILSVNGEWAKVACTMLYPNNPGVNVRKAGTAIGQADSGYYAFGLFIENKTTACDAAFDNFQLAKISADGKYLDVYTGEDLGYTIWDPDAPQGGGSTGGGSTGGGSTGTGTGGGSSSATTGDSFPVASVAVAGLVIASAAVILKKKVR